MNRATPELCCSCWRLLFWQGGSELDFLPSYSTKVNVQGGLVGYLVDCRVDLALKVYYGG